MTNDTRKPREFSISLKTGIAAENGPVNDSSWLHVIEYSAFASLQGEIEEFKAGVQNFKCPSCSAVAGPFYPVNLMPELEALRKELEETKEQHAIHMKVRDKADAAEIAEYRTEIFDLQKERDEYRAALEHFASVHEKAVPYQDLITGEGSVDKLRSILAKYPNGAKKERK